MGKPKSARKVAAQAAKASDGYGSIRMEFAGKSFVQDIDGILVLKDTSVVEVTQRLNELPGEFAYWSNFQRMVEDRLAQVQEQFNMWYADAYAPVIARHPKATEKARRVVFLGNAQRRATYEQYQDEMRRLRDTASKAAILIKSCDIQQMSLRAITQILTAEIYKSTNSGKSVLDLAGGT